MAKKTVIFRFFFDLLTNCSYDSNESESEGKRLKPTPLPHMRLWFCLLLLFVVWSDSGGDFGGGGGHRHSGLREGDHVRGTQGHDRLRADQGPRPQTTEHSDPHRAPLGTGQVAQPHPLREVHARGCAAHGQPNYTSTNRLQLILRK